MNWFEPEIISFFEELEKNNNKEWFQANKKRYENFVKEPFFVFVAKIISMIQQDDPAMGLSPKDAIFRIYRDVRFSRDKRPYKTNCAAIISSGGRKDFSTPGLYLEIRAQGINIYEGAHFLSATQLDNLRSYISKNSEKFHSIIDHPDFIKRFGAVQGEKNKRLKKEFTVAAQDEPLLYNKQFYCQASYPGESLLEETLPQMIYDHYLSGKAFNQFLSKGMAAAKL